MRISRPPPGAPPTATGPQVDAPAAKGFAAALDKVASARKAGAMPEASSVNPSTPIRPANALSEVSTDLRAGRITPAMAVDRVVQHVLDRQLGVHAPAAVREQVGAALRRTLEDDPVLSAKVRSLTRG